MIKLWSSWLAIANICESMQLTCWEASIKCGSDSQVLVYRSRATSIIRYRPPGQRYLVLPNDFVLIVVRYRSEKYGSEKDIERKQQETLWHRVLRALASFWNANFECFAFTLLHRAYYNLSTSYEHKFPAFLRHDLWYIQEIKYALRKAIMARP